MISPGSFNAQQQDLVVAAITSQVPDITEALILTSRDFSSGTLPKTSVVKPNKLFTIHSTLIIKKVTVLTHEKLDEVLMTQQEPLRSQPRRLRPAALRREGEARRWREHRGCLVHRLGASGEDSLRHRFWRSGSRF